MQDGSKRLKVIWRREWEYQKRELILGITVEAGLLILLFLVYLLKKSWLFAGFSYVRSLPPAMYAFVGFTEESPSASLLTFIEIMLMCFHIWLAWSFGNRGLQSIWREEEDNNIFLICNQWCSRYQLSVYKASWAAVSMLATYFLLCLLSGFLLLLGSMRQDVLFESESVLWMFGWMLRSGFSLLLLLAVCISYGLCCQYKERTAWVDGVVFGTLVVGNLYKIRDMAFWILERLHIEGAPLKQIFGWLEGLYWISPLSWINPNIEISIGKIMVQMIICIVIAGLFMLAGFLRYRTRELGW